MEQFSLEKWLQDNSRKVVTRDGRPVRIVCWDAPTKNPIYGFVEGDDGITNWQKDGRFSNLIDNIDLFFADEEEKLTEFENTMVSFAHAMFDHLLDVTKEIDIKEWKDKLIDLARKELQPEIDKELDEAYKSRDEVVYLDGYDKGHEDALKDLPKWKKAPSHEKQTLYGMSEISDIYYDGYYITISDLQTLPKEE